MYGVKIFTPVKQRDPLDKRTNEYIGAMCSSQSYSDNSSSMNHTLRDPRDPVPQLSVSTRIRRIQWREEDQVSAGDKALTTIH